MCIWYEVYVLCGICVWCMYSVCCVMCILYIVVCAHDISSFTVWNMNVMSYSVCVYVCILYE